MSRARRDPSQPRDDGGDDGLPNLSGMSMRADIAESGRAAPAWFEVDKNGYFDPCHNAKDTTDAYVDHLHNTEEEDAIGIIGAAGRAKYPNANNPWMDEARMAILHRVVHKKARAHRTAKNYENLGTIFKRFWAQPVDHMLMGGQVVAVYDEWHNMNQLALIPPDNYRPKPGTAAAAADNDDQWWHRTPEGELMYTRPQPLWEELRYALRYYKGAPRPRFCDWLLTKEVWLSTDSMPSSSISFQRSRMLWKNAKVQQCLRVNNPDKTVSVDLWSAEVQTHAPIPEPFMDGDYGKLQWWWNNSVFDGQGSAADEFTSFDTDGTMLTKTTEGVNRALDAIQTVAVDYLVEILLNNNLTPEVGEFSGDSVELDDDTRNRHMREYMTDARLAQLRATLTDRNSIEQWYLDRSPGLFFAAPRTASWVPGDVALRHVPITLGVDEDYPTPPPGAQADNPNGRFWSDGVNRRNMRWREGSDATLRTFHALLVRRHTVLRESVLSAVGHPGGLPQPRGGQQHLIATVKVDNVVRSIGVGLMLKDGSDYEMSVRELLTNSPWFGIDELFEVEAEGAADEADRPVLERRASKRKAL